MPTTSPLWSFIIAVAIINSANVAVSALSAANSQAKSETILSMASAKPHLDVRVTAADQDPVLLNRRAGVARMASSLLLTSSAFLVASAGSPQIALADVTNKLASSAALRSIKRAAKELDGVELLAVDNDYAGVRSALRVPPFTEVRKNCVVLIRAGEDTAESDRLEKTYADFKTAIEALDSQAGLGVRGRKNIELGALYTEAVATLANFVEVADRVTTIPLQSSE